MADQNTPKPAPKRTGFAAYDTRLTRFVGGVYDTKAAAESAGKDRGVKASDLDVREV